MSESQNKTDLIEYIDLHIRQLSHKESIEVFRIFYNESPDNIHEKNMGSLIMASKYSLKCLNIIVNYMKNKINDKEQANKKEVDFHFDYLKTDEKIEP